ncbi:uncharacterized protein LOC132619238 isoform X1 [Lycium barbarum]|uniref:uncharacterized protein LOC132619238 isoform X1 n=1 Tax=Lycium barbarum TaxID=112863 RepID=UPI00293E37A2|nr:uncharacterized protein LOC132619238 isoform X1 [Lycium barbarum]XP_060190165.1 uncharacterized protein LOC132619238 isoform X1 [Lycium barbarum]
MGTEDSNDLPASYNLERGTENNEDGANGEISKTNNDVVSESKEPLQQSDSDMDLESDPGSQVGAELTGTLSQVGVELTETVEIIEEVTPFKSVAHAEDGLLSLQDGTNSSNHKEDQDNVSTQEIVGVKPGLSGVKRPRATLDVEQPSVHVVYNSLTRESKKMLEGLLQQWSEWHAKHCSSAHDSREVLESGEETYFPALHVGLEKPSAVTYWVDKQARNDKSEFIPLDGNSIPLYDRGYSFALTATDSSSNVEKGMEMVDSSRCFNCGSYGHALKDCPKPRDNAAVNNARKQHKSRRNQSASSRNPTRYYQDSPRGKYDGLRPGALDPETRKLLGLGELDPPPWINRMREMGYPPGYLEEDEDQPSGITIFADEEKKEETEEGEILDKSFPNLPKSFPNPPRKMSVDFPGVNAPIPEHADERRWEAVPSSSSYSRSHSHNRYNHAKDNVNRGHYHERRWSSRDYEDDGPPGVDPGTSPSLSGYSYRYGAYDSHYSSHSPRDGASMPRSPSFGRSLSDRDRRSPLVNDGNTHHSFHHSYYGSPR